MTQEGANDWSHASACRSMEGATWPGRSPLSRAMRIHRMPPPMYHMRLQSVLFLTISGSRPCFVCKVFPLSPFCRLRSTKEHSSLIFTGRSGTTRTIPWDSLLKILQRVHGWDMNGSAVRITVFSLYVALLEEVSPPDIWGKTLVCGDFFEMPEAEAGFHVIIGNPPWAAGVVPTEHRCAGARRTVCPCPVERTSSPFTETRKQNLPQKKNSLILQSCTKILNLVPSDILYFIRVDHCQWRCAINQHRRLRLNLF